MRRGCAPTAPTLMTTGDIARALLVCQRTAARMIDDGEIEAWKIPGSKHRRATRESVMAYAARHGIPVADDSAPEILSRHQVAAMVDMPPKTVARWIEEGRLRESRIRWRRGITLDDLLDFCNANDIRMRRVD